ncbi:hypothetical protein LTR78_002647 [Recurvomyces mirabilis]|uniref:Zn(2)-C6 fungal-type domain-containing protein n=1 Tax=Recurvomyces mirabilis TaxID=574656 RepID=A0AAE0WTG3_9PEZI|nr:hypothetical protein LTR78_002647 [Recurvomyces mirabilis]KAK5157576.1 hypothetical protein LTS14_004341 [Recurvomyces mirabilis]
MNPQQSNYSQYPPPPQQNHYGYASNPYPTQQQNAYPAYPTPQQQLAPHQVQAQQAQFIRPFQQPAASRSQQQTPQQRSGTSQYRLPNNVPQQPRVEDNVPTGPGAPPADDLEEQLRTALQRESGQAGDEAEEGSNGEEEAEAEEDEDQPIFNLPPPPEGTYPTEAELEQAVHSWSLEHGYELVRRASKKNANGKIYKRYLHCSKYGKLANTGKLTDATRVRKPRKTNRQGCPMSLAIVALEPSNSNGQWQVRHRKTHHNHGPVEAVALTGHRRRARQGGMEKAIDGLFQIGTPTTQVLQFLQRTNQDGLYTRTDVANMKLKFKKFGTCITHGKAHARSGDRPFGATIACNRCRKKKCKCDRSRPTCQQCQIDKAECVYDKETTIEPNLLNDIRATAAAGDQDTDMDISIVEQEGPSQQTPTSGSRGQTQLSRNRAAAEQILNDLRTFQSEHVKAKRLDLKSSSVEILAQSSCGSGTSYTKVPTLTLPKDWDAFSEAFVEASQKENLYDTLLGERGEPIAPVVGEDEEEVDVDDWNEYIKQQAIFNRRNGLLLGSLWSALGPSFRTRVQGFKKAADAWASLEEICSPRGSEHAYKKFSELTDTNLETCGNDLQEYIGRLETAWHAFAKIKRSQQVPHDTLGRHRVELSTSTRLQHGSSGTPGGSGADVLPEETLCFLFLRGLGDRYRRWVETLCQTSNVAGFGTGYRVGFKDLTKRAAEWEGLQSRVAEG